MRQMHVIAAAMALLASWAAADGPKVRLMRVPDGGIQPQLAVDEKGTEHLLYYKGHEAHGDLFYTKSSDGGASWTRAMRVNSQEGSALSIGTIRGGHIALGSKGRVHVAWMGSDLAEPKAPGKGAPMLYTRLNDEGTGFEPQRNVIQTNPGLDGGGSIAAAGETVYVAWHAPISGKSGEENRRVWMARSETAGEVFAPEQMWSGATGVCGCCGMAMASDHGTLYFLYRSATESVHRDMWLLSKPTGRGQTAEKVGEWNIGQCVMSTASLQRGNDGVLAAWESHEKVFWRRIDMWEKSGPVVEAPGKGSNRKHPRAAGNSAGQVILVWTEETGWNKGGKVAWQIFDAEGKPMENASGKVDGVPVWSLPATFADGSGFVVLY